jgi:hypothetical protein
MPQPLKRICLGTLILFLCTGQAAAFDLQIGHLNFGPAPAETTGHHPSANNGFGATLTVPLGFSGSNRPTSGTLNGQALSSFTEQDAKDSLIVIMLFGVAIAAGVLTASAASE